ncbi:MAG: valine--tRNA ligase [Ilumatobacter sp.]|uniref:valine--tRNA ligase n=1 Tax=Ilumatobacter sp. TaxID=1967498 RepID=UPI00261C54FA|nr:valine--tRNA ligase [Ilumatobacter sp.]MDJ0769751.1 valine--tRNA ligase [Ilumatobacter sp.]
MSTTDDRLTELPKAYVPADAEPDVKARWAASDVFHAEPVADDRGTYSIVIPPPNVTAALHLGHALNNTLQDVLIRYHRMCGDETLWLPGTDHAGIATQTVVEKRLLAEGVKRLEMGRDAFVAKTQEWKDEYEQVIIDQLVAMGASCDFDRTRFTMDEMCATAVRHAFFTLFRDGLVYRGKRLVNWDPATRTALADDEVEMEDVDGHMWYLQYPLEDGSGHVTVATTRPETMLGDTAVAINPQDPRADSLLGSRVVLPIVGRVIPIIADDYVVMADPESSDAKARYASGFLKVTPAHDTNDWDIGLRHDLPVVNVLGPDASISDEYGWDDVSDEARPLLGMSREAARAAIVEWFEQHGLLEEVREYQHSVGHSYRSHVPIEPWLSDQWYVAVTDDRLRGSALRAQDPDQAPPLPAGVPPRTDRKGDGGMRIIPERYARTYHAWHEGIRDWCVSRQLWWGHQIPVWVRIVDIGEAPAEVADAGIDAAVPVSSAWVAAGAAHLARRITEHEVEEAVCVPPQPTLGRLDRSDTSMDEDAMVAALEADGFTRDPDVLDTWFSSALWPISTMGWPWPEDYPETVGLLESFNPTSVLSTGREIITLWVSRMVMFERYFLDGRLPYRDVFIHAIIQDGHGQPMSKSLGNGLDPRDVIHTHGADALRFTLMQMTTDTQDVRMPVDIVDPHSGQMFEPEFVTTPAGKSVPAPIQTSPADPSKRMVSAYGVATGTAEPTDEMPLARNTSSKFDLGRNFANKLWNATRFALRRIDASTAVERPVLADAGRRFADRWILARLVDAVGRLEDALDRYQFNVYADTLYTFVWNDVCDRYLEMVKPTIDDDAEQQVVLAAVLDAVLRLMHPVMPFVTEALWPHVAAARCGEVAGLELPGAELLAGADWPAVDAALHDRDVVAVFDRADALIGSIRALRGSQNVAPRRQIVIHAPQQVLDLFTTTDGAIEVLAGIGEVHGLGDDRPAVVNPLTFEGAEVLLSGLVDDVDLDQERARLQKIIDGKTKQIGGFKGRLGNPGFLDNAKPDVIADTRALLAAAEADLAAAETALANLG